MAFSKIRNVTGPKFFDLMDKNSGRSLPRMAFSSREDPDRGVGTLKGRPWAPLGRGAQGWRVVDRAAASANATDRVKGGKPLRYAPPVMVVESKRAAACFHRLALCILFRVSPLRCFPCYQYSTGKSPMASKHCPGAYAGPCGRRSSSLAMKSPTSFLARL